MNQLEKLKQEMKGCFIDDKIGFFPNLYFKWKVDLIHIKSNNNRCLTRQVQLK
jgi:hypothetical protein